MRLTVLSAVLARANSDPPHHFRDQFYAIKQCILSRWGTCLGSVYQRIEDRCWGEYGNPCDKYCGKCCGTGVYRSLTVELEAWSLRGRVFHRPVRRLYGSEADAASISIVGRVQHRQKTHARHCAAALFLLFAPHWIDGSRRRPIECLCLRCYQTYEHVFDLLVDHRGGAS